MIGVRQEKYSYIFALGKKSRKFRRQTLIIFLNMRTKMRTRCLDELYADEFLIEVETLGIRGAA